MYSSLMKKSGTSKSRQVIETQDSSLTSSSHNDTSTKSPLESATQSSNNVKSSLNYSTNPQSSSQLFYNSLRPEEDTSTRAKAKKRGNNKEKNELQLPRHHDSVRKNSDVITKTNVKSRKKKYTSPIYGNKQHRHHNRRHHRKVKLKRRASAVSNETSSKEKYFTKHRRSLQHSPRYPLLRGGSERVLLRFKRISPVEDNGEGSTQNRKKRKRKNRRQALNRHAKQRSIPVPNVLNVPVGGLRTGYPRGLAGEQTSLTRNLNGFINNRNTISRAKYEQLINRSQAPSLSLNPYMVSSNGYGWRKSVSYMNKPSSSPLLPSGNFAKSGNQFANKGQVQLSPFSPETSKLEIKPATRTGLQNAVSTLQTQIQQPAKWQHASEQLQKSNQLTRKQFIPVTQRSFYGYVPQLNYQSHFINSQLPYSQPGMTTPHTFPRVSTWMHDWPSVLPETNSQVITEGDALRRSRGPQGLIMYLNFEDVARGKAPYASFKGDLAGASKRTEISRSFGSCGKIARINNGSEILLKGGQIKVIQFDFSPKEAPEFNERKH